MAQHNFHGGCQTCTAQQRNGISYCDYCQYQKGDWYLADLSSNLPVNTPSASTNIVDMDTLITSLPQMPQVQYDSQKQLEELRDLAHKFGLWDAADYLRNILLRRYENH